MNKDKLFGSVVIQRGWVSATDVLLALNVQVKLKRVFGRKLCLGEILYIRGLVNEQQLKTAVRSLTNPGAEEADAGNETSSTVALLGEVLIELGYATHLEVLASLDIQASEVKQGKKKRLIGAILFERESITQAQLKHAIEVSKRWNQPPS